MNKKVLLYGGIALAVIIIGAILFMLAGGGGGGSDTPTEKTTLVYWGLWEAESVMQPLIDAYEQQNPTIEIQYVQKPFTQYESTAFTRIQQTTVSDTPAPDILRINNTWLSKFQPYLYPMPTTIMTNAQYADIFYPTAVKDFTGTDGYIYAIPLEIDGLALFYNKQIFEEANIEKPPADWDSVIETAKKLTVTENGRITQAGLAMGSSKNVKHSADIFNLLLLQNGVEPINSTNTEVTLTVLRAESAMNFYTEFVTDHKTWSGDLASDLEVFYSGKLAMMFAPSWRAFDIIESAPNIEFGISAAPQLPGNNASLNYSMYWGEAVSRTSPNSEEAWKFIQYLSEREQLKTLFSNSSQVRAFGEPYSRKSMASELTDHPYAGAFMDMAPSMESWKMGEQSYVEEALRTAINSVSENGDRPDNALREAEKSINEKLAESIQ